MRFRTQGMKIRKQVRQGVVPCHSYGHEVMGLSVTAAYKVRRRFIRAVVKLPKRVDASAWGLIDANADGVDPAQHIIQQQFLLWQRVVAHALLPLEHLRATLGGQAHRLWKAKNKWLTVNGPCAALLATCLNLELWMRDERHFVDEQGNEIDICGITPTALKAWVAARYQGMLARDVGEGFPHQAAGQMARRLAGPLKHLCG
eukprot:5452710-Amphidinium_carterae.1